jgi:hypothetical protein
MSPRLRALLLSASSAVVSAGLVAGAGALAGCSASRMERSDGMSAAAVPPEQQADYALFAQRCSKCHSLARPLDSGIADDDYWRMYVEKMRRQPSSGITVEDTVPILRFLHWYSQAQLARKAKGGG